MSLAVTDTLDDADLEAVILGLPGDKRSSRTHALIRSIDEATSMDQGRLSRWANLEERVNGAIESGHMRITDAFAAMIRIRTNFAKSHT